LAGIINPHLKHNYVDFKGQRNHRTLTAFERGAVVVADEFVFAGQLRGLRASNTPARTIAGAAIGAVQSDAHIMRYPVT
jgi:hypothetical protein